MLLKVGELAKRTGLTVRTLHHYDEIGLLRPSGRGDNRYRLYGPADVARLHAIQALRGLGLGLDEIDQALGSGGAQLPAIVARQLDALEDQIRHAQELRERLQRVQAKFAAGAQPALEDWLSTLSLMTASAKYFDADELRKIFADWSSVEADLRTLAAEIRALMDADVGALDPRLQPLAHRWMALMLEWMGGDFDRMDRWGRMFRAEPATQGGAGVDRVLADYIQQAVDQRLALLRKYLDEGELRRIAVVPRCEWQALAADTRSLIAAGTPADSDAARALAARRSALLGRLAGNDAALGEKLRRAYAAEPLLRLGASLPPDVRDYLDRVPGAPA